MKFSKKLTMLVTIAVMLLSVRGSLLADDPYTGYAYNEGTQSSNLAPVLALGLLAVGAIVVVAFSGGGHHHHKSSSFHAH